MIAVAFAICAVIAALVSIVLHVRRSFGWGIIANAVMLALLGAMFLARHDMLWPAIFEFAVAGVALVAGIKQLRFFAPNS